MAQLPNNLDYTDKDFDSILQRLQNVIQSVFPNWTDFNRGNFGNILLESFAFVMDVVLFYQDGQARETRWVTANERKNLLALTKLIGFEPKTASAASTAVTITATVAVAPGSDVTVTYPIGTLVRTLNVTDPIEFQILSPLVLTILSGELTASGSAQVENSVSVADTFVSSGLPNQEFVLTRTPYIDASSSAIAANGSFVEEDSFLDQTSTDKAFTLQVDEIDRAKLRFGNGTNGVIPTGTITADYKTGGGEEGNVEAATLVRIEGSFLTSSGTPVVTTLTNPDAASGGADRETNASIRQRAPETLRVLTRAVSREDFEIVARGVAGVARSLMLTSNEDVSVPENTGHLIIIPEGGGTPSQTLKDTVLAEFIGTDPPFPSTLTFDVIVQDPVYLTMDVRVVLFLASGASAATVDTSIRVALVDYLAVTSDDGTPNEVVGFGFDFKDGNGDPAGEIPFSDIFNVVRDVTGVRKIGDQSGDFLVNSASLDVTITPRQFPQIGTVTLINGDTGNSLV